ncbi:hypothetical protein [Nocardioides sp.]|uniref:hypothetical protein n=1 Tax=Nocardioides sp. TaxID=35761 RepID=UPI00260A6666|nr:hypothetical protein [Nocardioides sp.]
MPSSVPADVLADASAHEDPEDPDDLAPVSPPTVEQPAEPGGVSPLSQSTGGNTL